MSKYRIGQYFNIDGILLNLKYISRIHKIRPDIYVKSIVELDLARMKNDQGIKYIVFDKDNTLTYPHVNTPASESIVEKLEEFKQVFGYNNVTILSNSAGSPDDPENKEALEIEKNLKMKVIKHINRKPRVYKEILYTLNLTGKDFSNREICVVGDRLLVDVVMGKDHGFFTILTDPLNTKEDNLIVKQLRKFEKYLINRFK